MAQVSVFSPWEDASRGHAAAADNAALCWVKCIADIGQNGGQVDQATVQVATAADTITMRTAENGGAIAAVNDVDSYTGATGANGTITTVDANTSTVQTIINALNGVAVGQTAFRFFRAALADVPPALVTVASDLINRAQTNILLGLTSPGIELFLDTSNVGLIIADDQWLGIGTDGGTIAGAGWIMPDYYEDIPGSSTTASVNRRKQFRITGFAMSALHATTENFEVRDINNNVIWNEPLTNNVVTLFQDRSDNPIVGPVGSPLFCRFTGTGGYTDGTFMVQAEYRWC
jgi:hypothetical protein